MFALTSSPAVHADPNASVDLRAAAARRAVRPGTEVRPDDAAVQRLFASCPVLAALAEPERAGLLRWSRLGMHAPQAVIWREGDNVTSVIFVLSGYMKLTRSTADGSEAFLDMIGPGECAGGLTAAQKSAFDTTATVLSRCRLLMIDARQFRQVFERNTQALLAIMQQTQEQQNRIAEQLIDGRFLFASARLAKVLVRLSELEAPKQSHDAGLLSQLSQGELAAMAGTCREMVCKHLHRWRRSGWVRTVGGTVTWVHVSALAKLTENEAEDDQRSSVA